MEDKGKLPVGNRFFKVLVSGFEQALKLPTVISRILNDGEVPEEIVLVSCRGSWNVSIGKFNSNGLMLNGKGWDTFVRCHDLSVGHFLVFEHSGNMHFHTLIFDSTTCDKEFPDYHEKIIKRNQERPTSASNQEKEKGIFQVKLQPYSIEHSNPRLYLPTTFMKSNLSFGKKTTTVTLINPSGDKWNVDLRFTGHRRRGISRSQLRYVFDGGWKKFVRENKLKLGNVCVFKVISHSSSGSGSRRSNSSIAMNVHFIRS